MYSAITTPKRSLLTGRLAGTHQKIDRAARRTLTPFLKHGEFFPGINEILHFEGRRGPDGLKLKSIGVDEPEHFINPNDKDPQLVKDMEDHYSNLKTALKEKNNVRAAFEAAWLAHLITDGLTPAHHVPFHETVDEMMGEKEFLEIFGKPIKGIMRGETAREAAKNNWKYWGVNGLMSRHVAFEYGVAAIVSVIPAKRYIPKISTSDIENFDLKREFFAFLEEINNLDMYGTFADKGWTPKLTSNVEKLLLPTIVRLIALSWLSALPSHPCHSDRAKRVEESLQASSGHLEGEE